MADFDKPPDRWGPTLSGMNQTMSVLLALVVAGPPARSADTPVPKPDPWQAVRPLLGSWEGEADGQPGKGRSAREYRFTLNDRFIQVTAQATYPPQEKNPKGEVHEDVGFLSYDKTAQKLVLRQFHGEGFVNHYVLASLSDDRRTLVFETVAIENIPAGWRAREIYRIVSDDEFLETFALAAPGKEFDIYSATRFRRKH